jgi:DNA polymerase (family X)
MREANAAVVRLLDELADLTELDEGDPASFRVRAYRNAQRAVEGLDVDVATMSAAELAKVRGIGKSIAARIREHADTGRITRLEELRARHPVGQLELRRIPGLGPKSVARLDAELGVRDVAGLMAAIEDGRLLALPGFGERTVERLRQQVGVLGLGSKQRRVAIADALPVAERIVQALVTAGVRRAALAGSLRRFRETIGDVDVLVDAGSDVDVLAVLEAEIDVVQVVGAGATKVSVVTREGLQVDVRRVPPASFGAALVYFTGSKAHNIRLRQRAQERGGSLNEYGLTRDALETLATEEEVYTAVDLPWIPPELREDSGEIEAAEQGRLPRLISVEDLRGDLHDHTDSSGDGRMTLEQLVEAAVGRGLDYLAVTDHGEDLTINGVPRADMLAQRRALRALEDARGDIALLHGAELNIGLDGGLDYDDAFLAGFDWLVASVHSYLDRDADTQTTRLLAAIRHPSVTAIGHLTGRMLGRRAGIDLDVDRVLDAARETGTAIEINASLRRLEPPEDVLREAAARGVALVLSSDAHDVDELDRARHGVSHARRAGVTPKQVANTLPRAEFLDWLAGLRA